MYRIDNATSAPALPAPSAPGPNPNSYFTKGNPGLSIPATIVDDEWLNTCQEEIANAITGFGVALDKSKRDQLSAILLGTTGGYFRRRLTANTTFYVSTAGNDVTGNGTAGLPWRTAQFASDYVQKNVDLNGFTVTVMRAAGAYTDGVIVSGPYTGAKGPASFIFDGASMATVTVTAAAPYQGLNGASFIVQNQKLVSTSSFCISASYNSAISYQFVDFGAATSAHVNAAYSSLVSAANNYTISGSSQSHASVSVGGAWVANAVTVTLTGTPTFTVFVNCQQAGVVNSLGVTWTGAATGSRYTATLNGVIYTTGSGPNYFPGNSAGTTATGGQYT